MKKIAVVFSGCGNRDGAEITETVSTLISLSQFGATYQCFAPELNYSVTNYLTGAPTKEKRDSLSEAARIARGNIKNICELDVDHFDGLIFPGGQGAASHLSSWSQDGSSCSVNPEVRRIIEEFNEAEKPIGAICIAPTLLAKVLGHKHIIITLGPLGETTQEAEKTGAVLEECATPDYIADRTNKILTTPAYMWDKSTSYEVFTGIQKMIKELVHLA